MATRGDVESALAALPDASGVIVTEPTNDGRRLRALATRPAAKGGGTVLVVLGDPAPEASTINMTRRDPLPPISS